MVRKKLKKVRQDQHDRGQDITEKQGDDDQSKNLLNVVNIWLKNLNIRLGEDSMPRSASPQLDVFGTLQNYERGPFTQVRGLQGLRNRLQDIVAMGQLSKSRTGSAVHDVDKIATSFAEEVKLVYLLSLLLYMDPDTAAFRKIVKGLLLTAEKATIAIGSMSTDHIVKIVFSNFLEMAHHSKTGAVSTVRSLQWLVDTPAGKRALLDDTNDGSGKPSTFDQSFALLDLLLQAEIAQETSCTEAVGAGGGENIVEQVNDVTGHGVRFSGSANLLDCCGEILKATACLMSLNKHWEVRQMQGGDPAALRISAVCLKVLSAPAASREAITHASSSLTSLAIASWRSAGLWPRDEPATTNVGGFESACLVLCTAFFPAVQENSPQKQQQRNGSIGLGYSMTTLVASFRPLPPRATLAICRAIVHTVSPAVLLANVVSTDIEVNSEEASGDRGVCLLAGPVLRSILMWSGAGSLLQLRFFALQVLEAWLGRAKSLVESTLFQEQKNSSDEGSPASNRDEGCGDGRLGLALVEVMELAMEALVHPSKLISSIAPVLLEHVVNLRQLVRRVSGVVGAGKDDEWEGLVERVMTQSVLSKGRYIAISVLLPRVGALRLLELGPMLVEQLVWAVGTKGNISGHASSLLLQLLTTATRESVETDAAVAPPGKGAGSVMCVCRGWWVGPAAGALTQNDRWSRGRCAAYLLPELFKVDPGSVVSLFAELRKKWRLLQECSKHSNSTLLLDTEESAMEPGACCMWAMLEVARHARKSGAASGVPIVADGHVYNVAAGESSEAAGLLQLEEVKWAALHSNETLRMSAISLLCTDLRITTVPSPAEINLLKSVLPYSLKVYGAQSRQVLLRALQILLSRMRETVRVCVKGKPDDAVLQNRGRGGHTTEGQSVKQGEGAAGETLRDVVKRVENMVQWLCEVVLESLYPGCPYEREVLGLEILQLVLAELLDSEGRGKRHAEESDLVKVVSSALFCQRWADTLLSQLGSSWDRTRSLSYSILARFPRPLAGYDGIDGAIRLSEEGLHLSGSGRQRESERGALILRLVHISHASGLGLNVPLLLSELKQSGGRGADDGEGDVELVEGDPSERFLKDLCSVLTHRLDRMESSFMALLGSLQRPSEAVAAGPLVSSLGTILFPHGILLAIHHVLLDSQIESGIQGANNNNLQHHVARRNSNHAPAATAVPHGLAENSREHKKQLARGRCSVMVLLLEQVLRALRLSLLIVGERHDEPSSTSSSGAPSPEPGEDIGCDSTTTGDAPTSALTANLGHTGTSKTIGITGDTAIHAVASAGKSSRSVNANGHMGGIAIDHRGRVVSTSVTSHEDSATAMRLERYSDYDGDVDRKSGNLEVRSERGSGAAEGQRAVVGAWLLAKETCRCLSTIVTAARLPPSSSDSTTTAAAMDTSGVDEREGESISREEFGSWMLSEKDVMGIGEALLESLLALKHMGCVASAQAAFQAVCETLLQDGHKNTSLSRLPSLWLGKLIDRLTGAKNEFVLRRSAGLAAAFIAILRAEPRSVAPVLLPRGMRRLLALVRSPANLQDWRERVHALNVLRVVFIDATLADDIGLYVTETLMAAVCGFEDAEWAVRNSSMMLFASIMQRAVGGAKNIATPSSDGTRRPHSARGAVTANAFFQQHNRLHAFLLEQLARAASHTTAEGGDSANDDLRQDQVATGSRAEMHPVLYPILLLLARLRNSGEDALEGAKIEGAAAGAQNEPITVIAASSRNAAITNTSTSAAFMPLVIKCGGNPHFLARAASARALAAIVSPTDSPRLILDLLRRLPQDATTLVSLNSTASAHNHVHGTLLQLLELILAARAAPQASSVQQSISGNTHYNDPSSSQQPSDEAQLSVPFPKQAQLAGHSEAARIAERATDSALEHIWLADPTMTPCPPIRLAMLLVLEALGDWLGHACLAPEDRSSARGIESGASCRIRSTLRTAREANLEEAIKPGAVGRHMPGQSLLVSYVISAGVKERLESAFVGKGRGNDKLDSDDQTAGEVKKDSLPLVLELLSHSNVDVRDAAIKTTKKWFGPRSMRRSFYVTTQAPKVEMNLPQTAVLEVWVAGARALVVEVHPPNIRRLLRLLSRAGSWLTGHISGLPQLDAPYPLWEHLCLLCDNGVGMGTGAGDIHAGALEVLGVVVRLAGGGAKGVGIDKLETTKLAVNGWGDINHGVYVSILEYAADPEQPLSTRVAATQSLASSGLLVLDNDWSTAGEGYLAVFVRVWFVLLSLLQDHDDRVRVCAARVRSAAGGEEFPCTTSADIEKTSGSSKLRPAPTDRQYLRQVQAVLTRMISLAEKTSGKENGGRDAAEHVVLALLRAFSTIPGTSLEELLEMASLRVGSLEKYRETDSGGDLRDTTLGAHVADSGREGCGGEGEEIFSKEDHTQFEEPSLFSWTAAPCLWRALIALGASIKRRSLPEKVAEGVVTVLRNLAEIIECFVGPFAIVPSATWLPEVYGGVTATLAVGTVVLQFVLTHGGSDQDIQADYVQETASIAKACSLFNEAGLHRGKGVHPDIQRGVARVFELIQSYTETSQTCR